MKKVKALSMIRVHQPITSLKIPRKKLNKREMMKLDVEYKRLEASWLEVS
jgi:hypothetical protein